MTVEKKKMQKSSDFKQEVKNKDHLPDPRYPETRLVLSRLQFQVEIFRYANIYAEYSMTIPLQGEQFVDKDMN